MTKRCLLALADRLAGLHPKKTLALLHGAVLPERCYSFADVLDQYTEFKTTEYEATDQRLKLRDAKKYFYMNTCNHSPTIEKCRVAGLCLAI